MQLLMGILQDQLLLRTDFNRLPCLQQDNIRQLQTLVHQMFMYLVTMVVILLLKQQQLVDGKLLCLPQDNINF